MTRAEYEAKYGASAPVKMTRQQYEAKYGASTAPTTPTAPAMAPAEEPISSKVSNFFGFGKTVDTLGSLAAKTMVPKEQRQYVPTPTGKEIGGAALNIGSTLFPAGAVRKAALGIVGKTAAGVASGAAAGYGLDVARDLEQNKSAPEVLTPGAGTVIGSSLPGVATGAKAVARNIAPRLINSLIKPLNKGFSYGKNPGRAVSELGITANSLEELATNISASRDAIGVALQKAGKRVALRQPIDLTKALSPFDDAITKAVNNNDQALYNRLNEARTALTSIFTTKAGKIQPTGSRILDGLTYEQAVDFKRRIGNLTKWTGQQTEDESVNGALTRAYGIAKETMNKAAKEADPELAKQLAKLNEQYADLTSAEIAAKYRDVLQQRQNMINLPGKIGITAAAVTAPFTGGLPALLAAGGSIAADKVLSSPAVKTRAAKTLSKLGTPAKRSFRTPGDFLIRSLTKGN